MKFGIDEKYDNLRTKAEILKGQSIISQSPLITQRIFNSKFGAKTNGFIRFHSSCKITI